MTGAIRVPAMATAVPRRIVVVCSAARARQAYTSDASIWLSMNQACEKPICSASIAFFQLR